MQQIQEKINEIIQMLNVCNTESSILKELNIKIKSVCNEILDIAKDEKNSSPDEINNIFNQVKKIILLIIKKKQSIKRKIKDSQQ